MDASDRDSWILGGPASEVVRVARVYYAAALLDDSGHALGVDDVFGTSIGGSKNSADVGSEYPVGVSQSKMGLFSAER